MVLFPEPKIGVSEETPKKGAVTLRKTHQPESSSQEGKEGSKHPDVTLKFPVEMSDWPNPARG